MNEEHLNIYREGVTAWNQWREANPYIRPDLSSASLGGADYRGANFSFAILHQASFADGTFSGADFSFADLRGADFSHADLRSANFSHADLTEAKLNAANLSHADLNHANLFIAHLFGTDLITARNLTQQQLDTVLGCNDATLPNGLVCNKRIILPPGYSLFDA